jgi:putative glutamine amidotransferase
MKKVLVPLAMVSLKPNSLAPLHFIRETYLRKLIKYGINPVLVSPILTPEMVDELYSQCDGAMFMGGFDFEAKHYGEIPHPKNDKPDTLRDELELYLMKKILNDKKPFFGICRGMQALNIVQGGNLIQHIVDLNLDENHGDMDGASYEDLRTPRLHTVNIEPNTKAYKLLGTDKIETNSMHHQAVKNLGRDLIAVGKTNGGIIEIIEHADPNYFCFGVQWHPEAMEDPIIEKFFEGFAESL